MKTQPQLTYPADLYTNTVCFPMICGSGGSKSRLAKAARANRLGRWEMNNCTPLWHETHFEVKMCKAHQVRSTFGSWDVGKVHAVAARSTFRSKNAQNTPCSGHFWKLRCWNNARRCGAKHISKSKCTKHLSVGPLLEVDMLEKVHAVVAPSTCGSESVKSCRSRTTFGRSDVLSRGRRKGLCILPKVCKTRGFCGMSKNDGRRGTLEEDPQRCVSHGRRSTRDVFNRDVRRSGGASDRQVC